LPVAAFLCRLKATVSRGGILMNCPYVHLRLRGYLADERGERREIEAVLDVSIGPDEWYARWQPGTQAAQWFTGPREHPPALPLAPGLLLRLEALRLASPAGAPVLVLLDRVAD